MRNENNHKNHHCYIVGDLDGSGAMGNAGAWHFGLCQIITLLNTRILGGNNG